MSKQLEVNKDYGFVFGFVTGGSDKMIYRGGDTWTGVKGDKEMTVESKGTTTKVSEYINRPSIIMGSAK